MASTVAKFRVDQITRHNVLTRTTEGKYEPSEQHSYQLGAVYSDDPSSENKKFWQYTPSGTINLSTVFPQAVFELGKELYVLFTDEKPNGL